MGAKRKKPIPVIAPYLTSRKKARKITTTFHRLTSMKAAIENDDSLSHPEVSEKINHIKLCLEKIGGIEAYQNASILNVKYHNTSKWVTQELERLGLRPTKGKSPLTLLEIGAINTRLLSIPWLKTRAIDIRPVMPQIEKIDFFDLTLDNLYDIAVLSMVLNCVPTPKQRGEMLLKLRHFLKNDGYLFIMLPLMSLTSSKYMTRVRFESILKYVGFDLISNKDSPRVTFYCLKAVRPPPELGTNPIFAHGNHGKSGRGRMDFSIQL